MAEEAKDIEVSNVIPLNRYEVRVAGDLAGFADYRLDGNRIAFTHTEVSPDFGGQGLGTRLVEFAVTDARRQKMSIEPACPFVRDWIDENPE